MSRPETTDNGRKSPENFKRNRVASSFRDPSGFVFFDNGVLCRQVNGVYSANYDLLLSSGLYDELIKRNFLVRHREERNTKLARDAYKIIRPEAIPFISYPYEWCFSELKDAALLTLEIQKIAMRFGMSLRDASAYNIQFLNGRPILIDTLSFEKYEEGRPWAAYGQFCRHFLAPLALASYRDIRLNQLLRVYIDGIPLDLASELLPWKTNLRPGLFFHVHVHAKSQKHYAKKSVPGSRRKNVRKFAMLGLLDSLKGAVSSLKMSTDNTEWADYYDDMANYSDSAMKRKKELVLGFLERTKPGSAWDLGANDGMFSRLADDKGIFTVSLDIDPIAVEKNYLRVREVKEKNILPLIADLANPSPAIGWANEERMSLVERGPADLAMALALIHHLAISNNLPFANIADFMVKICRFLIIEFVPKEDEQVQKLLRSRDDIFPGYKKDVFENDFQKYFTILDSREIGDSKRTLYLMEKSSGGGAN